MRILALPVLALCAATADGQGLRAEIGVQGVQVPGGSNAGVHTTAIESWGLAVRGGYGFTPRLALEIDLGLGVEAGRRYLTLDDIEPRLPNETGLSALLLLLRVLHSR